MMSNNTVLRSVIMLGDVMLGRVVNDAIPHYPSPLWGNTLQHLQQPSAMVTGNLECAVTHHTDKPYPKTFNFALSPNNIQPLKDAHFKFVSLANNHCMDFYEQGLEETMHVLDQAGIAYAGVGVGINEASQPVVVAHGDEKIAFLSYSDHPVEWRATNNKLGINYIDPDSYNRSEIEKHIQKAKEMAEIVIVFIHWGPNYSWLPSKNIQKLAHDFIDCGASCIFGHSAHHIQGIEIYKQSPIIYGAGGWIDDYALDEDYRNDLSFLYEWHIDEKKVELIPTHISHVWTTTAGKESTTYPKYFSYVNIAGGDDAEWLKETVKRLSAVYGTQFRDSDDGSGSCYVDLI